MINVTDRTHIHMGLGSLKLFFSHLAVLLWLITPFNRHYFFIIKIRLTQNNLPASLEPTTGIEPVNLFLTKEALYRLSYVGLIFWSGRRGSNSRHSAWKAEALPTELLPLS